MLDIEIVSPDQIDKAVTIFHQDGFVAVRDVLTPEQLEFGQAGAQRVVKEQMDAIPLEEANRGYARYSFGQQVQHPEWSQLIDLPTVLPILDKIWGSQDFVCTGAGGDYSTPGAKIQSLHADMGDFFNDPLGKVTFRDVPSPFIVVNFLMTEFKVINGGTRFIRGTQRSRQPIPSLEEEPEWMKNCHVCAPAGTALIRDVRAWHGGTPNDSDEIRIMISSGYTAPWFQMGRVKPAFSQELFDQLSERGKQMCHEFKILES
jgi:hypothetical protein